MSDKPEPNLERYVWEAVLAYHRDKGLIDARNGGLLLDAPAIVGRFTDLIAFVLAGADPRTRAVYFNSLKDRLEEQIRERLASGKFIGASDFKPN